MDIMQELMLSRALSKVKKKLSKLGINIPSLEVVPRYPSDKDAEQVLKELHSLQRSYNDPTAQGENIEASTKLLVQVIGDIESSLGYYNVEISSHL